FLAELKPFLPDTLVNNLSGNIDAEIITHGKLNPDSIATQINDIIFKQSSIKLIAQNISLTMPDTLQKITDLNGEGKMENGTVSISKTNGVAAGVDFLIDSASFANVYESVFQNKNEM